MSTQPSGTVLIVDDTEMIRRIMRSGVESLGYAALTAAGGEEALALLGSQGEGIDVVISDVMMPVIDGFELMEKIHELRADIPVILMTAFSDVEIVIEGIKKRAFDLILKPVDTPLLQQAVEKALKHRHLLALEKNYLETLELTVMEQTRALKAKMAELEESRSVQAAEHEALKKLFRKVQDIKQEWERTMDCIGDMVLLVDLQGRIRRCNQALRLFTGRTYQEILGSDWQELFRTYGLTTDTAFASGAELHHAPSGRWFVFDAYPFSSDADGASCGTVITIHDTTVLKQTMDALAKAYQDLQATQAQMLQSEKMASIGQLAAGVAHELNNPIGFVASNLNTLNKYLERLVAFITAQTQLVTRAAPAGVQQETTALRQSLKIDYILQDLGQLISESLDGTNRVCKIIQDLKTFSRADQGDYKLADLTECLESAITIAWNELKYKATLRRDYGDIPRIKCYPQQLNQVFMNLLVNAGHAIEKKGEISITTRADDDTVSIAIADTGGGIAPDHLTRIFEPFFTTKDVGKGTGLGLSISYDIIKRHRGEITVASAVGAGTTFTVTLPLDAEPDETRAGA